MQVRPAGSVMERILASLADASGGALPASPPGRDWCFSEYEAYAFWEGADGVLRGSPHDEESQWFAAKVELHVLEGKVSPTPATHDKRKGLNAGGQVCTAPLLR